MKKRIFLLCCVVGIIMPIEAHAAEITSFAIVKEMDEKESTKILQIRNEGCCYFVKQPEEVQNFLMEWEQIWKTGTSPTEHQIGYDGYTVDVLTDVPESNHAVQYSMNVFSDSSRLKKTTYTLDEKTGRMVQTNKEVRMVPSENMQEMMEKLEDIEKNYYQYDELYTNRVQLDAEDVSKIDTLGMVLNNKLHFFQNALIDQNGILHVSLEDWNTIFDTQYGNTKNLIYQNGTIKNNALSTNISYQNINGKVYVPLREAVNHFGHLSMEWDKQMRKAVVMETAVADMQNKVRSGQNFTE